MNSYEVEAKFRELLDGYCVSYQQDEQQTNLDRSRTGQDRGAIVLRLTAGKLGDAWKALRTVLQESLEDAEPGPDYVNLRIGKGRLYVQRYWYRNTSGEQFASFAEQFECDLTFSGSASSPMKSMEINDAVAAKVIARLENHESWSAMLQTEIVSGRVEIGPI